METIDQELSDAINASLTSIDVRLTMLRNISTTYTERTGRVSTCITAQINELKDKRDELIIQLDNL